MKNQTPTLYLAPLNKLGNLAFRTLCLKNEADFVFSEMVKIDELLNNDQAQLKKIEIPKEQQCKTIIQILAENINLIEKGIEKIKKQNPEIKEINYNMGCPQSSLCKAYSGGGIIKSPQKIKEVTRLLHNACKKHNLTPSIKTRIGITRDEINIHENIKIIKNNKIKKIYLHGRVLKEPYTKPATYEEIAKVINQNPDLEIIANGDITDLIVLRNLQKITNYNQILIGRAAVENPEIFSELKSEKIIKKNIKSGYDIKEKKEIIMEYLKLGKKYELTLSQTKSNLSYLTKGCLEGAKLRRDINDIKNIDEIMNYFKKI